MGYFSNVRSRDMTPSYDRFSSENLDRIVPMILDASPVEPLTRFMTVAYSIYI